MTWFEEFNKAHFEAEFCARRYDCAGYRSAVDKLKELGSTEKWKQFEEESE